MDEWILALRNTSTKTAFQSNLMHKFIICSHARPTFCNVCREALNGVTSHGLSCEICKFKAHKRCASRASLNCKWTTLASIGSQEIIEDEDRNIWMPHQWLEGNLPVNAKCSYCEKACGSVLRMQDFRCLWCKSYVHSHCKENYYKQCNLGLCRVSILPPTHVNEVASDGYIRASRAPNSSPLVVFVNSKSGDNQGIKFLRKFKQLLNPFQVFDLIQGGPVVGLRLFQKFDCFRVLVCGGDGSVGWVLKEIDALNLHKKCQIGVLPLGTGNDLARVLGWGAVLDDDNQLPKLLESFERSTTKMLDRWSIMTYEAQNNASITSNMHKINNNNSINTNSNNNVSANTNSNHVSNNPNASGSIPFMSSDMNCFQNFSNEEAKIYNQNLSKLEDSIWYHLNNLLQNENINSVIESSIKFNDNLNELLIKVYSLYNDNSVHSWSENINLLDNNEEDLRKINAMTAVIIDQCISLKLVLDEFFLLLKNELKPKLSRVKKIFKDSETSAAFSESSSSSETDENDKFLHGLCDESSGHMFRDESDEIKNITSNAKSSTLNFTNLCTSSLSLTNRSSPSLGASVITHAVSSANTLTPQDSKLCANNNNPCYSTNANTLNGGRSGSCNSSIQRRQMLNSISHLFRHRRKVMNRSNHLKSLIKQIIKLADKNHMINCVSKTKFLAPSNKINNDNTNTNNNDNNKMNDNVTSNLTSPSPKIDITCFHPESTTTTATNSSTANNTAPTSNSNSLNQEEENYFFNFKTLDINKMLNNNVKHNEEDLEDEGYIQNELDLIDENQDNNKLSNFFKFDNLDSNNKTKNLSVSCQPDCLSNKNVNHVSSNYHNSIDYHIEDKKTDNISQEKKHVNQRPNSLKILSPTYLSLSSNNLNNIDSKANIDSNQTHIQILEKQENLPKDTSITSPVDIFEQEKIEKINSELANLKLKTSNESNSTNDMKSNKIFSDLIINELRDLEKKNILSHSLTSSSISYDLMQNFLVKSPSTLTINKTLCSTTNDDTCPLASEEQSCMSTPNLTKLSPSIDSIYKQQNEALPIESPLPPLVISSEVEQSNSQTQPLQVPSPLFPRPNQLDLQVKNYSNHNINQVLIKVQSPSNHDVSPSVLDQNQSYKIDKNCNFDFAPHITIQCENDDARSLSNYDSDFNRMDNSRSPSFLGYLTSASSVAITPSSTHNEIETILKSNQYNSMSKKQKGTLPPLLLLPPAQSTTHRNKISFNSSSSSNNLSSHKLSINEFSFGSSLGIPASPSGYSSSGSCFSKTPLPSPRISKKYCKDSKNYLQLRGHGVISALSVNLMRRRSRSKSSEKSSSPTSPISPKFSFKYNPHDSAPFGFIGQALLFNADTLCAPITSPAVTEPILELYNEKAVMNNYFGIGLDAKLCLEFHLSREEHPEKCSRIRNRMLYGLLGSKEFVQRTYKNLEQKVLLECDGTKIPLKNVQGIVVLNIPSYTGGVNFWGHNSKDENIFVSPSFDDKILEVVAVSGCMQMALSRVVSIKSNRIAQCRSVKIQILGQEGVPVQVDGEAWIQPPGFIYLTHKNRAQMLTRNKVFEHSLKIWSEKQKDPHLNAALTKEEFAVLQCIVDDAATLIKRIKTASLKNCHIEQDLCGYANQASSNLEEISINGKILEKSLRQQVTDFLNSIRTLHVETCLFINEKSLKLCIEQDIIEKIQLGLNDLKSDMKKLNECHGVFQFPIDSEEEVNLDPKRKSRFNIVQRYKKSKIKHKDDKELLKTLHGISIEEWGPEEVSLWLESLNLAEYKAAFMRHDIRGTEIRNLERRDLRELGIVKVGHIKRILNASKLIPKRVTIEKQSV